MPLPDGTIRPRGQPVNYLMVYRAGRCLHCRRRTSRHGPLIALGHPYYGVLHMNCAHHYEFPDCWPHHTLEVNLHAALNDRASMSSSGESTPPPTPAAFAAAGQRARRFF